MKRYLALLETTWWLWLMLGGLAVPLTIWVDSHFIVLIPVYAVTFLYFAIVRFDEEGNRREYD